MFHPKSKYYNLLKHTSVILDALFIVSFILDYFNYLPVFFNVVYIFYFTLIINTFFLVIKIKHIRKEDKNKENVIYLSKYLFLLTLLIIALNQFLNRQIVIDYMYYIVGFSIASGFLTFYSSKENFEKQIEKEKNDEVRNELERKDNFKFRFPRINNIPIFRSIVKWMYKEGWWYCVLLIAILVFSVLLKTPYFDNTFTGEHFEKYMSYVGPAYKMYEVKNPLANIKLYRSYPVSSPFGINGLFGESPLLEWYLVSFYTVSGGTQSIEYITHFGMALLGAILLLVIYLISSKYLTKKAAICFILLLSLSLTFNLVSFFTVQDTLMLIFGFFSLLLIIEESKNSITYSAIFAGLALISKETYILMFLPILVIFLFNNKLGTIRNLTRIISYFSIMIIPKIIFAVAIDPLPGFYLGSISLQKYCLNIGILIFGLILISFFYLKLKGFEQGKKEDLKLIIGSLVILFFAFIFIAKYFNYFQRSAELLTDWNLVFNLPMYEYILFNLIGLDKLIYIISVLGILFYYRISKFNLGLILGSFIYILSSSKVIFFHDYYAFFISLTLLFFFVELISRLRFTKTLGPFVLIILSIVLISSIFSMVGPSIISLNQQRDMVREASEYITNHTTQNDRIISHGVFEISFYANRVHYDLDDFIGEDYNYFVSQIKNNSDNLCITLKQNNITYYVFYAHNYYSEFTNLAYLYDPSLNNFERTDLIKSTLNQESPLTKYLEQKKIVKEYKIDTCFKLEREFGDYKIYRIVTS